MQTISQMMRIAARANQANRQLASKGRRASQTEPTDPFTEPKFIEVRIPVNPITQRRGFAQVYSNKKALPEELRDRYSERDLPPYIQFIHSEVGHHTLLPPDYFDNREKAK